MKAWFDGGLGPRRTSVGHWIPPGAVLPDLVVEDPTRRLLVGRGARLGSVRHAGTVTLVRAVDVHGLLDVGGDVVLGAGCHARSDVRAGGRVVVQNGRVGGRIEAGGDVLLLGACRVGDVRCGGDIAVSGKPKTGKLEPGGRVATRPY